MTVQSTVHEWYATKSEAFAVANRRRDAGEAVKVIKREFTNPRTGHVDVHFEVVCEDRNERKPVGV